MVFGVWGAVWGETPGSPLDKLVVRRGVEEPVAREVFVADGAHRSAIVELRGEVTVRGAEIRLRQVARWSDRDAGVLGPVAELVVVRLSDGVGFASIGLDELQRTLRDAGVNLGQVQFAGAVRCTISRADVEFDEGAALEQWAAARGGRSEGHTPGSASLRRGAGEEDSGIEQQALTQPSPRVLGEGYESQSPSEFRTLREILVDDLATRVGVAGHSLHVTFNPIDEKLLNLPEPHFRFHVEPRRGRGLGEVSWEVLIISGDQTQKAVISAMARAWQEQVVLVRPLSTRQLIQSEDVEERRVLVDRLEDETLLKREQVVGQQASRDLKPGTVMTARLVDATPLVRAGQLVTISVRQGGVQVKTAARAMEGGVLGQMIRVRNEATRDMFEVVLTGPQTAVLGQ